MTEPEPDAEVIIRPETVDDVEGVLDVITELAAAGRWIATELPFDRSERADRLGALLAAPDRYAGFVAEVHPVGREAGRIVGSIGLELAPYGVVGVGMGLSEAFRGRGLGTQLLQRGIEWSAAVGAHKVALEVWADNAAAIALYRKLGFVEEGHLHRHYRRRNGELWDALIMGLPLDRPSHEGQGPAQAQMRGQG